MARRDPLKGKLHGDLAAPKRTAAFMRSTGLDVKGSDPGRTTTGMYFSGTESDFRLAAGQGEEQFFCPSDESTFEENFPNTTFSLTPLSP